MKKLFSILVSLSLLVISIPEVTVQADDIVKGREVIINVNNSLIDDNHGLWLWGDDILAKSVTEGWPQGAILLEGNEGPFSSAKIWVKDNDTIDINFLIINRENGGKVFEDDQVITLPNHDFDEVWIVGENDFHFLEPSVDKNILRIYLQKSEGDLSAWVWGDKVHEDSKGGSFESDRLSVTGEAKGFVYFDVKLDESVDDETVGFLFHNGISQTDDYSYSISKYGNTIYTRFDSNDIRNNPFFDFFRFNSIRWIEEDVIEVLYSGELKQIGDLSLYANEESIDFEVLHNENNKLMLRVNKDINYNAVWSVSYLEDSISVGTMSWELMDKLYSTDDELGLIWNGDNPSIRFWAPSADEVKVHIYNKNEEEIAVESFDKEDKTWLWTNRESRDLHNHYYQIEVIRNGGSVFVLDPYAKSMAPWNGLTLGDCTRDDSDCVAKAAFVNVKEVGVSLDFADIENYEDREDAIIYEMHVRDFTSDPFIKEELDSEFGTFSAFIERLDYVQELGVTHIQLLPIMSYYFADELNKKRVLDPTAQGVDSNYNWGYDPHSYFSISGMYSEDPREASLRIEEFKQLIDEIHKRGMGVILDVVFNHTARLHIFEDIEPNYYHFMDASGNPKQSFGGGRLGTTHYMSRRILLDSIEYWTKEFKVDGFRFDMMGDHDAETIQMAYDIAQKYNPKTLFLGEGWRTYEGDDNDSIIAADQDWMKHTSDVGVFSDEYRNMMKSGYPNEGSRQFLTGGSQNISMLFDNIKAQPHNFIADEPKDVVQYLEAHDNLTLHDVIAISIKKSPQEAQEEILKRQRLGNLMLLTSQGTIFIHAGQEFGRTRQVFADGSNMDKTHKLLLEDGTPIEYPYFVSDAYNSSDGINLFDWNKALYSEEHVKTRKFTEGLIKLRKEVEGFRLRDKKSVDNAMQLVDAKEIQEEDLVIAYKLKDNDSEYYVLINADEKARDLTFDSQIYDKLKIGTVIVDQNQSGTEVISNPKGIEFVEGIVKLDALTGIVIQVDNTIEIESSKERVIFHAWNWSFDEIEKHLEELKDHGFDAVQTSPVQPLKSSDLSGDRWWLLYQPTDYSFGNPLGTRDEFISMNKKADALGIEIIVDVVLNHLANDQGGSLACQPSNMVASRFKDPGLWHEFRCVSNWLDRNEITQLGIGLPDLNTQDERVQEWAIDFLNDLIDMGVDGFRFDAAKHIELPNDSGVQSDFWPNVINGLNSNVYLYGEILQDINDEFYKYSEIMDVTASNYGYSLKEVIEGAETYNLFDYRAKNVSPDRLVTWVESHDTYANDEEVTTQISENDLILGWAVLVAREKNSPLFFNRPNQEVENKFSYNLGERGNEFWKDDRIKELNEFRQYVLGSDEYLRYPDGRSIAVERGQKGMVIVNFESNRLNISNMDTRLADGMYVNALNENETFTIRDGKLNGKVEPKGIVILKSDSDLPVIEIGYDNSLYIKLDQYDSASYRINGSEWNSIEQSLTRLDINEDKPYFTEYLVEVRAENEFGEISQDYTHTIIPKMNISVYFKKPADWANDINIYVYDAPNELLGSWPGEAMEQKANGWYVYSFDEVFSNGRVIINEGDNQYPAQFTPGIYVDSTIWIDNDFEIHMENPDVDLTNLNQLLLSIREDNFADKLDKTLFNLHDQIVLEMLEAISQADIDELTLKLKSILNTALTKDTEDKILAVITDDFEERFNLITTEQEGIQLLKDILANQNLPEDSEKPEDSDKPENNEKPGDVDQSVDNKESGDIDNLPVSGVGINFIPFILIGIGVMLLIKKRLKD